MISSSLLARYGATPVPRYTSYPPANHWADLGEGAAGAFAEAARARVGGRPLSLYVHVPFCRRLCLYCGCNMMVTQDDALVERYLRALEVEIERAPARATVGQLHLGGGTPTFLDEAQLARVVSALRRRFSFASDAELAIEIHPAVTSVSQLRALRALGFNRLSMGVQDFDPEVQARVNRPQPFEETRDLVAAARALGFASVNVDLMYGLPLQTVARFEHTLDRVEELAPDRIALFGYAHVPGLKKHQRLLLVEELPDTTARLAIFERALERLLAAGYVHIGLDHFARPGDELCRARERGTLRRNFMGYTTGAQSDVLAFGPSAISEIDGIFLQNERDVRAWAARIEAHCTPVVRGYASSSEDLRRGVVIQELFCKLEAECVGFASELARLRPLEADGLVTIDATRVRVTPAGQLLLRNVAAVFDAFLAAGPRPHAPAV